MNPLILTGYTRHIVELGRFLMNSKMRWANKHGLSFVNLGDSHFPEERGHPAFQKLFWIRWHLEQSNKPVLWIDADSLITNMDVTPNDFCQCFPDKEGHCVAVSADYTDGGREVNKQWSSGNMLWLNTAASKIWLDEAIHRTEYAWSGCWDQDALQATQMDKDLKIMPSRFMNSVHPELYVKASWKPGDFLCHFTGMPQEERLDSAKKFIKEYHIAT